MICDSAMIHCVEPGEQDVRQQSTATVCVSKKMGELETIVDIGRFVLSKVTWKNSSREVTSSKLVDGSEHIAGVYILAKFISIGHTNKISTGRVGTF